MSFHALISLLFKLANFVFPAFLCSSDSLPSFRTGKPQRKSKLPFIRKSVTSVATFLHFFVHVSMEMLSPTSGWENRNGARETLLHSQRWSRRNFMCTGIDESICLSCGKWKTSAWRYAPRIHLRLQQRDVISWGKRTNGGDIFGCVSIAGAIQWSQCVQSTCHFITLKSLPKWFKLQT